MGDSNLELQVQKLQAQNQVLLQFLNKVLSRQQTRAQADQQYVNDTLELLQTRSERAAEAAEEQWREHHGDDGEDTEDEPETPFEELSLESS